MLIESIREVNHANSVPGNSNKGIFMNPARIFSRTLAKLCPPRLDATIAALVGFFLSLTAVCAQPGTPVWTNRHSGPDSLNAFQQIGIPNPVAVDNSGNVVVTGPSTATSGFGDDYVTVKYSGVGVPLWTNRYDGPANDYDTPYAAAVDGEGNVFVTGTSAGNGSCDDYATIKYSSAGVPLWTNRYDGPGNGCDAAYAVAVSSNGNVYVTGRAAFNGSSSGYATIAYSNAGLPLWTNFYRATTTGYGTAYALATDGSNNVCVTGGSPGSGGSVDFATLKYSSTGVPFWTNRYNAPNNDYDAAYSVAVDGNDDVLVTGASGGSHNTSDYATLKYSSAGFPLWTNLYKGPGGYDAPSAIAVDSGSNVFVTGESAGSGGASDYATIKYSSAGDPLWTNRYNGPGNGFDSASALVVDGSGNVYVTGESENTNFNADCVTLAYSGTGVPLWTNRYDVAVGGGAFASTDFANGAALDGDGNVYVTGYSDHGSSMIGENHIVTIKYAALPSGGDLSPIALLFQRLDNQLVLSWTNAAFGLQSAPFVSGVFTNISGAASPHTNALSGDQQFFRLKAN